MKINAAKTVRHFTLVELMIAMTVLVIMMGFLFQFIISAQRLWSASNNNDVLFEQAQLCFDLIEKDFKAAIVQEETSNPGRGIPYYINPTALDGTSPAQLLCLVTQTGSDQTTLDPTNGSDAFPVVYYTDTQKNLYRRVIDTVINSKNPLYCYGMSVTDFTNYRADIDDDFSAQFKLCDNNIASIKLDLHPITIDDYHLPEIVKITLELTDLAVKDSNTANTRIFSKTIFLH